VQVGGFVLDDEGEQLGDIHIIRPWLWGRGGAGMPIRVRAGLSSEIVRNFSVIQSVPVRT
jgi:hypothetical protein